MVRMFILRAQSPLSLSIGPFGEMSNVAFIKVNFNYYGSFYLLFITF